MSKDLGISSRQYSIVLTIFYVPYILAEYPAALLMKRLGPHIMLPALTLSFGLVTALQGLVTSYGGLIACRIVLALTEGKPKFSEAEVAFSLMSILLFRWYHSFTMLVFVQLLRYARISTPVGCPRNSFAICPALTSNVQMHNSLLRHYFGRCIRWSLRCSTSQSRRCLGPSWLGYVLGHSTHTNQHH